MLLLLIVAAALVLSAGPAEAGGSTWSTDQPSDPDRGGDVASAPAPTTTTVAPSPTTTTAVAPLVAERGTSGWGRLGQIGLGLGGGVVLIAIVWLGWGRRQPTTKPA